MVMVEETYLPLTLYAPGLSDNQFQEFCDKYPDFSLEYTTEGELVVTPPTDPETGVRNAAITYQLMKYAIESKTGRVTDSSAGFVLPSGARLSPDAAWISLDAFQSSKPVPEFVIELLSPSDRPTITKRKMAEWIENGVRLAWMIDPRAQSVTIYRSGLCAMGQKDEPEVRSGIEQLAGEGPVDGFILDLRPIWNV